MRDTRVKLPSEFEAGKVIKGYILSFKFYLFLH